MKTPLVKRITGLLAAAALALPSFAQSIATTGTTDTPTAPAITPATKPAETPRSNDIIELETFSVVTDKDTGYLAVDALAGGRTAMPLKFTPSSMDAITREFMDDFAITNIDEAIQWATNVVTQLDANEGGTYNLWDYNFRGAGGSRQGGRGTKRNYNTFFQSADGYNTQRFEIGLGPNSILYGIGGPGGNISVYTKIPRTDRNFGQAEAGINTYGAYRFTLDYNQRLTRKFALRVNTLYSDGQGYRDFSDDNKMAGTLALLWKPTHNTQLRVEAEAARYKRNVPRSSMNENFVLWDQSTIADTNLTVLDPMPTGVALEPNNNNNASEYWVYTANNPSAGIQNYSKSYKTTGRSLRMAPYAGFYKNTLVTMSGTTPLYIEPSSIPLTPSDSFTWGVGTFESRFQDLTIWLDHQFSPTTDMQISLYRYSDAQQQTYSADLNGGWTRDINKQLPDGTENPNFGKLYGDSELMRQLQQRQVSEARVQLNYRMRGTFLGIPYKQRFSVGASVEEIEYHAGSGALVNADIVYSGTAWADRIVKTRLYVRQYMDSPHTSFTIPDSSNGQRIEYRTPAGNYDFDQTHKISNATLASHTLLWEDKLSILAGVRYDDYSYVQKPRAFSGMQSAHREVNKITYSAGGVYYLFGWLGFVANYSYNCDPILVNAYPSCYGTPLPTAYSQNTDLGIRISTPNGKYYANINRYFGTQTNKLRGDNPVGFKGIINNYQTITGETTTNPFDTGSYTDVDSLKLEGYEASVTMQPIKGFSMRLSFAYPEVAEIIEGMELSRQYFNEHYDDWNNAVTLASNSGDSVITNAGQNLEGQLKTEKAKLAENVAGREVDNHIKYTISGNMSYQFQNGPLKGFRMGMGVSYQAKRRLNTNNASTYDNPLYSSDKLNGSVFASYTTRIFGLRTSFQLNIDNAFNETDAFISGYHAAWTYVDGSPVPNRFDIPNPINGRLTIRVSF